MYHKKQRSFQFLTLKANISYLTLNWKPRYDSIKWCFYWNVSYSKLPIVDVPRVHVIRAKKEKLCQILQTPKYVTSFVLMLEISESAHTMSSKQDWLGGVVFATWRI